MFRNIVFPINQLGNSLARCPLSSQAPRNGEGSHTVTTLFSQLLLNAGSLTAEHQRALICYSH